MYEQPINILLIEDTPSDAALAKRLLNSISFVSSVEWAQSIAEAIDLIQQERFDLILTDLGLPDSNGIETVVRLREINNRLPLIALTGQDDDDLGMSVIRKGANDFIPKNMVSKPIILRAIIHTIERHRMTKNLKEANSRLESKNEHLAHMYNMSQQFVDNVSHEFRTPLTVIREFAAIVRDGIDGPVTEEQQTRLSTLIGRTDDLARMVDDLLDTSRLEAGLLKAIRQEHDLSEIVGRVVKMLGPRAKAKKIEIKIREIPAGTMVFCDEEKLRRTLINLIVNAIKFTPIQGHIEISAKMADKDRMIITVSDNGPGIAKEELNRIFERFEQVESHHRMASCRGFGLGLSIARALASLNLGSLQVASVEGAGSQFSVLVPVANMNSVLNCYFDQRAATQEGNGEISLIEITPASFKIEDESDVLETIDDFLKSSVKTFDLVLQTEKNHWLVYSCNSQASLPGFLNRIEEDWSKLKRNHYGAELPNLTIEEKITTHIQDGRNTLMQLARPITPSSNEPLISDQGKNRRVLVVDDELEVAGAIEARLKATGYEVTIAHDGEAGLSAVEQTKPHAILLDVRMPKLDGLAVLSRLKENPKTASTPVIVLSASLQDKQAVLDIGASYFIQKPFQSNSILAALDAALQQNQTIQPQEESS